MIGLTTEAPGTNFAASRVIPFEGIIAIFPRAFESDVERTSIMYCTIFWRVYGMSIVNVNPLFHFVTFTEHATHSSPPGVVVGE